MKLMCIFEVTKKINKMILTPSNWTSPQQYAFGMLMLTVAIGTMIAGILALFGITVLWAVFFATIFILGPVNFFVFTVKELLK